DRRVPAAVARRGRDPGQLLLVHHAIDQTQPLRRAGGGDLDGARAGLPDRALPGEAESGCRRGPDPSGRARRGRSCRKGTRPGQPLHSRPGHARMTSPNVLTYRPGANEYAWTFGGVAPVARVTPGTVLELFSEDAFGGRVRSIGDLVSQVIEFPY